MQQAVSARTPAHLWIVGFLSLLWNAYGCFDYLMTRLHNMAYLASAGGDPNRMLAYIEGMPMYAQVGWGLGVWGAILGSVLLLMRSRWAVPAFGISLLGAVVSIGFQMMDRSAPAEMTQGMMRYVPLVIIVLAALQFWYSWRQRSNGVLR
jgi:hypothetical protein